MQTRSTIIMAIISYCDSAKFRILLSKSSTINLPVSFLSLVIDLYLTRKDLLCLLFNTSTSDQLIICSLFDYCAMY